MASITPSDLSDFNALLERTQEQAYQLACLLLGDEQAAEEATGRAVLAAFDGWRRHRRESFQVWLLQCVQQTCRGLPAGASPALGSLPLDQRLALLLVDCLGLDYTCAARVAGWPVKRLSAVLAAGRCKLAAASGR